MQADSQDQDQIIDELVSENTLLKEALLEQPCLSIAAESANEI